MPSPLAVSPALTKTGATLKCCTQRCRVIWGSCVLRGSDLEQGGVQGWLTWWFPSRNGDRESRNPGNMVDPPADPGLPRRRNTAMGSPATSSPLPPNEIECIWRLFVRRSQLTPIPSFCSFSRKLLGFGTLGCTNEPTPSGEKSNSSVAMCSWTCRLRKSSRFSAMRTYGRCLSSGGKGWWTVRSS